MTITNILLTIVVLVIAIAAIYYYLKKKKNQEVEATLNIDDKTYTLDVMKEFVKKRLDEITKVNLYAIGLSEEGSLVEFPAGYFEFGEDGKKAGIRELAEETGYMADEIIYLGNHYQDPGSIKAKVDVYLALNCKKVSEQQLDKGEFIKYIEVPYDLALDLLDNNLLMDSNSYIALSKTDRYLQKGYNLNNASNIKKKVK